MDGILEKIKEKKEFRELPESIISRVLELKEIKNANDEEKIKNVRAFLRKYFSVFITNKLASGKLKDDEILRKHISTKNREYDKLYKKILGSENLVIDLGCGLNGFSYNYFDQKIKYIGIEAIEIFVKIMNNYFRENKINGTAYYEDLFNLNNILEIIKNEDGKKLVFMFNVIDALENIERDYSKKLIFSLFKEGVERIVLSFPIQSISGKNKFKAKRFWLINFLEENFSVLDDFEMNGERFLVVGKK